MSTSLGMLGHSENTKVRDKYQESLTNSQKDSMFYLEVVLDNTA